VCDLDSILRERGHDTELIYLRDEVQRDELIGRIKSAAPDVICFPTNTHQWMHVRKFAGWIKEELTTHTIAGGIHAICRPDQVLAHRSIDFVCTGEGDRALPKLLHEIENGQDFSTVQGIGFRKNGKSIFTEGSALNEDLDAIPFSDRSIFDMRSILIDSRFELSVMAGRGCPMSCTYCANSARKKAYKGLGKFVRMRSPKRLIDMIGELEQHYFFKTIFIEDDIFTFNPKWAREFLALYKARFTYPFKVYIHADRVDKKILSELKDAGCYMVMAGVEAGNETLRAEVLNRTMTNAQLEKVFRWCDEIGLATWTFNILGFPGETKQTVNDLFDLHNSLRPDRAQVSLFYPYPNTALFDQCKNAGLLTDSERSTYFEQSILGFPEDFKNYLQDKFWEFRDQSLLIQAQKRARGYFDFLDHFNEAKIETPTDPPARLQHTNIWGDERLCMFLHPRGSACWDINLRPNTTLVTAFALDPICLKWGGRGATFSIIIEQNKKRTVLHQEYIDPKANPWQDHWHELQIDLSRFSGPATMFLETTPHESGDLTGVWSVFSRPYLTEDFPK
jgi:radical SAM superfamily enzyme YgiQ (UPF0313 family)